MPLSATAPIPSIFFVINALEDFDWSQTFATIAALLRDGFGIDRVLYPAALTVLLLSAAWLRRLWSNPLFAASWLAVAGQAAYIVRRQEDSAPRYFLVLLAPVIVIAVLALDELALRSSQASAPLPLQPGANEAAPHSATPLDGRGSQNAVASRLRYRIACAMLLAAILASVAIDGCMLTSFVTRPQYQFRDAANAIRAIVLRDANRNPCMLGISGAQLSLMTGIPSLNDAYGTEDLREKVARYRPGWYVAWTGVPDAAPYLSPYRIEAIAAFPAFDDEDRTPLILYKLVPRTQ